MDKKLIELYHNLEESETEDEYKFNWKIIQERLIELKQKHYMKRTSNYEIEEATAPEPFQVPEQIVEEWIEIVFNNNTSMGLQEYIDKRFLQKVNQNGSVAIGNYPEMREMHLIEIDECPTYQEDFVYEKIGIVETTDE